MSLSAAVIDALVATGATVEQLAAAMKADLAEAEQRLAEKRAKDAARQRKSRLSRAVTVTPCDTTDAPPNDIYSNPPPPSETKVSSGGKRCRAKPTFELPKIIPTELWEAFEQTRRVKKKPLTDFGRKQLVGKLESIAAAGWNIEDVMTKAIIGQHDGFWMPDGRDSNIRRANQARAGPIDMTEYRERLERIGKADGA
jgi:hypothetical protein